VAWRPISVPVLQIAVGELSALDVLYQGAELLSQRCELPGLVQHAFDVAIEVGPLHPCHLHDRKRATFDAEPVGQIEELGAMGGAVFL
jgi:hypothetical protein